MPPLVSAFTATRPPRKQTIAALNAAAACSYSAWSSSRVTVKNFPHLYFKLDQSN
ncbi:MAG: hypothetical protein MZV70_77295 [Desulfobacterales bacterium]|nr:hypothetical protein [Desulfobacterales bacterium]